MSAAAAVVAVVAGTSLLTTPAYAATPAWSLASVANPTGFNLADTVDTVDTLTVKATGGTYRLYPNHLEFSEVTAPIAWNAPATGPGSVQAALEALPAVGPGAVEVTGGPGDETGSHPYTVTWVGKWSGLSPGPINTGREMKLTIGPNPGSATSHVAQEGKASDRYRIVAANVGSAPATGPITIADTLPPGLVASSPNQHIRIESFFGGVSQECPATVPLECTLETTIPPGATIVLELEVAIASPSLSGALENHATVSGGGASTVSVTASNPVAAGPAPFGLEQASFQAAGPAGLPDLQAGSHPFALTTRIDLNTVFGTPQRVFEPAQDPRDVAVELPPGFLGDPLAVPRCPAVDVSDGHLENEGTVHETLVTSCPPDTRVGTLWLDQEGLLNTKTPIALYNVAPERGYPAELGFNPSVGVPIFIYADLLPTPAGYRLRLVNPGALRAIGVEEVSAITYGDPSAAFGHGPGPAFLTNPTACSPEPLSFGVQATSWEGGSASLRGPAYSAIEGCDQLAAAFNPAVSVAPEQTQADTPSGYEVDLRVPQAPNVSPEQLATPDLKDAVVTLPPGVTVSPSAASGPESLRGCTAAQIDLLGTELGAGHPGGNASPYDDGVEHASPGHCPAASQIGDIELTTPLLEQPLHGHAYLAQPTCGGLANPPCTEAAAEEGKVFGLYFEISGSGVIVKLPGAVEVGGAGHRNDLAPGQLRTTFTENPQLPFEELKLSLYGGPRAPLANPQTCGAYTASSRITPWSAPASGPPSTPSSSFSIKSGPGGSPCAATEAAEPHAPSFEAGALTPIAGAYSPFVLKLRREDGSQRLRSLNATLPEGLIGRLAGVPYCPDSAIAAAAARSGAQEQAAPSCPPASLLGAVDVGAGPGAEPLYVTGKAYLAGPYKGAPLSIAFITPAVAGPFDLGTVVVRAALYLNPETTQVTAKSDPIPTQIDGVPLDVRDIRVNVDRPQFMLNPTNCDPLAVTALATSLPGQSAALSDRFQVGACAALGFKPKLKLSLNGPTHRAGNPALKAVLTMKPGEAHIARSQVTLPHSEFLDNAHIGTVCTRVQFNEGALPGEKCPPASIYGHARATTPLLDNPVEGPVYLRSSSHKLPDLVAALGGQIDVALVGKVDTGRGGGIRNTFEVVPDAPVSKFVLSMQGGAKGLLENSENICAKPQRAVVHFTAHNGKVDDFNPLIANSCTKKHHARHVGHGH